MKPDAYIRLYPGDWLKDTMHLDATSTGAYFLLILAHRGKPGIPNDDQTLRTIARVRETDWARVRGQIAPYFKVANGMWVNNRSVEDWERDCADYRSACERTKAATLARTPNVTSDVTSNVTLNVTTTQSESESESNSEAKAKDVGQNVVAHEARPASKTVCDEKWLAELVGSPAYEGIDVKREYAKMCNWCATNRRQPTRRRFINWLNRVERPMQASAPAQSSSTGADKVILGQEFERVSKRMQTIRATYGDHQSWSKQDRDEYNALVARKKELKGLLGIKY